MGHTTIDSVVVNKMATILVVLVQTQHQSCFKFPRSVTKCLSGSLLHLGIRSLMLFRFTSSRNNTLPSLTPPRIQQAFVGIHLHRGPSMSFELTSPSVASSSEGFLPDFPRYLPPQNGCLALVPLNP